MKPIRIVLTPTRSRPLNVFLGLVLLLAATLLFLALATYHPSDPSLNTVSTDAPRNWVGPFGATLSDLLLQSLGLTAFLLPVWMGGLGWTWMRSRPGGSPWLRALGTALAIVFVPAAFGLLPWHWRWMHAAAVEGVIGSQMAGLLVGYLNIQGAWLVAGALAATGIYFASAVSFYDLKEGVEERWIQLCALNDRWHNWREERAERKAEREAEVDDGHAETDAEQEVSYAPRRSWFAFFRRREPEPEEEDPIDEIPAFQRVRRVESGEEEIIPITAAPTRRSIWERSPAEAAPAAASSVAHAPVAESAAKPEQLLPIQPRFTEARFTEATPAPARFAELRAEESRPVAARTDDPHAAAALWASASGYQPQPKSDNYADFPVQSPLKAETAFPAKPSFEPLGTGVIAIHERADAELRTTTVAPKNVSGFKLPPSTLLHAGSGPQTIRENELREEAKVLVEKCGEFDVRGQVVQINPGPMVTTYEFKPEAGVKYSRVTGLADDLCLAMRAESILIERMAGKSTVGIQVPNHDRETIHLRDVLESETFAKSKTRLTIAMGKDINGRIVTADLASMPHVLIAGSTGSGKSVAINAMIMSLLFRTTPAQVRLILVDPKRVELGMYEGVPHLFTPIITEPKLAANALRNAVREMERRLKLLASRSVRNIDQYNKLFESAMPSLFDDSEDEQPLPYIVIIIDELADLMMLDRANVEESITRLAQMARAVGIHLILATQRPSVDVITGLIKANVPTRISFRLATKVDSRTILDTNGAEALLGRGDMLFLPPGTSRLMRLHAPYVSEKETAAVVDFWKAQGQAEYVEGFLESPKDERAGVEGSNSNPDENDPLFDDAVKLVFEFGKASTSLLQRRLRIGYGRAAHLIDLMERDGLVGQADGSRPRELLKAPGWLHEVAVANE
jgi:DNA segregation ATPase FtsK/SpoIIIE, S-DNA-T family